MEIRLRCKKTADGRFILGKIYTIREGRGLVDEHGREGTTVESGSYSEWYKDCNWTDYDFELVAEHRHEIHITCTDGKTTHAVEKVDGKVTKAAKAVCCPADTYNANIGAQLAFNRLVCGTGYHPSEVALKPEQPKQEDKPKFKVGDKMKITGCTNLHGYLNGEIVIICDDALPSSRGGVYYPCERLDGSTCGGANVHESDLEPYAEPKQEPEKADPEYYSGKVVCVEATDWGITLGKVYTVEKGIFTWNGGTRSDTKATTIEQFNNWFIAAKFIEFKGE